MKKLLCVISLVALTTYANAGVVKPSADSLQDDLGFSLEEQEVVSDREVASEDEPKEEQAEDSERDIASDIIESTDSKMQYWKY